MNRFQFPLLCLLFICFLHGSSQGYRLIQSHVTSLYGHQHLLQNRTQYDHAIALDSFQVMGNDTLRYNYRIARPSAQTGCSYTFNQPSWLGNYFIERPGNSFVFFNSQQDSIFFQGNNLGYWRMMHLPGNLTLMATYTGTAWELANGILSDSVRTFTLQVQDSAANPIPHYLNGRQWKVAKQYGFSQLMSLWEFPDTLAGHESMLRRNDRHWVREEEIWDFQVGDSLHILQQKLDVQSETKDYEELVLQSKTYIPTTQTTEYVFSLRSVSYWDDFFNPPGYTVNGTVNRTISVVEGETTRYEDQLPYASRTIESALLADPDSLPALFADGQYNGRIQKTSYQPIIVGVSDFDTLNNCFPVPAPSLRDFVVLHQFWVEGLGGPYHVQDAITPGALHHFERKPVWYRKGNEVWGTPLDFSVFVGVEEGWASGIQVFPHPMQDVAKVIITPLLRGTHLVAHDLEGRLVYATLVPADGMVTLSHAEIPAAGIYLLTLQSPSGERAYRKLVVQ